MCVCVCVCVCVRVLRLLVLVSQSLLILALPPPSLSSLSLSLSLSLQSAALGRQGWKFSIPSADPKVGFYGLDELVNYFSKPNHPKLVLKYPVPPRS